MDQYVKPTKAAAAFNVGTPPHRADTQRLRRQPKQESYPCYQDRLVIKAHIDQDQSDITPFSAIIFQAKLTFTLDQMTDTQNAIRPVGGGVLAFSSLLAIYFGVLTLVSGWSFTLSQFGEFWPYIVTLALGFGIQVGLTLYLKQLSAHHHHAHHMVAASGTTSTAAMLACCTHYLANILPVLGAVGAVSLVAQYQIELFWLGLAFNAAGLAYIGHQVWLAKRAFLGGHAC
jgi:hypothetical protein